MLVLKRSFDFGLFKGHENDIVFVNNKNGLNSIFYGKKREKVKEGILYNTSEYFYFNLSLSDFNYIKSNGQYNITFRNTLNEKESEICTYTLDFNPCDKECDICGSDKEECYDEFWNKVDRNKQKTKNFITYVSILIFLGLFSIIILILVAFLRGLKINQNSNRNANLNIGNIPNENLIEGL